MKALVLIFSLFFIVGCDLGAKQVLKNLCSIDADKFQQCMSQELTSRTEEFVSLEGLNQGLLTEELKQCLKEKGKSSEKNLFAICLDMSFWLIEGILIRNNIKGQLPDVKVEPVCSSIYNCLETS